ncbi:MAG: hypothetical protein ACFFAK_15045 [Promethearchaeota archaeon]
MKEDKKEEEEFQNIIEEGLKSSFKIKYMKGCLRCGSSKIIKKASPVEYTIHRTWANPDPPSNDKQMYRIRNECRECGHIWYEDTSYYINKKVLFFFIIFSIIFFIIFLSCLVFIMET